MRVVRVGTAVMVVVTVVVVVTWGGGVLVGEGLRTDHDGALRLE